MPPANSVCRNLVLVRTYDSGTVLQGRMSNTFVCTEWRHICCDVYRGEGQAAGSTDLAKAEADEKHI